MDSVYACARLASVRNHVLGGRGGCARFGVRELLPTSESGRERRFRAFQRDTWGMRLTRRVVARASPDLTARASSRNSGGRSKNGLFPAARERQGRVGVVLSVRNDPEHDPRGGKATTNALRLVMPRDRDQVLLALRGRRLCRATGLAQRSIADSPACLMQTPCKSWP